MKMRTIERKRERESTEMDEKNMEKATRAQG